MPEIKLHRRLKYAGDIHTELLKIGWPSQRAHEFVKNIPDADAVEVLHGRWAFIGEDCCVCSACHKHAIVDYYYCPNCGAKMDGDANG